MARIAYDETDATAFVAARQLSNQALWQWRHTVATHLKPRPGMRLLDLGSGTGTWAAAFTDWYDIQVVAVEPSAAMRAHSIFSPVLDGHAADIPVGDGELDAAWISMAIHHVPDLVAAATELRRVLRPGAPVLIRSAFGARHHGIALFRYFPEAIRVLDTYPRIGDVHDAFSAAGFAFDALEQVPQVSFGSVRSAAEQLRRDAHTPLKLITDEEFEIGLKRLRAAAATEPGPVMDALDLLVLR